MAPTVKPTESALHTLSVHTLSVQTISVQTLLYINRQATIDALQDLEVTPHTLRGKLRVGLTAATCLQSEHGATACVSRRRAQ